MIPWNKLPREVQKYLLISVILSGSASVSGGCAPVVCDPAPPPPTSSLPPTATRPAAFPSVVGDTAVPSPTQTLTSTASTTPTPMVCDPAPPPATATPRAGATFMPPLICDPAPNPPEQRGPLFSPRNLEVQEGATVPGVAVIEGRVTDAYENPVSGVQVTATSGTYQAIAGTDENGHYLIDIRQAGSFLVHVGDDTVDLLPLNLSQNDHASVDWIQRGPVLYPTPLPLAEIRTVRIVASEGLSFRAETPWPGARLRWTASGGVLTTVGETATWQPPSEPGRYLVQIVADWRQAGVAVDSLVFDIDERGILSVVS